MPETCSICWADNAPSVLPVSLQMGDIFGAEAEQRIEPIKVQTPVCSQTPPALMQSAGTKITSLS